MTQRSDMTMTVQLDLARLGLSPGPMDGKWGTRTQAGVLAAGLVSPDAGVVMLELAKRIKAEEEDIRLPALSEIESFAPSFRFRWLPALHAAVRFAHILPGRLSAFLGALAAQTSGFEDLASLVPADLDDGHEFLIGTNLRLHPKLGRIPQVAFRFAATAWLNSNLNAAVDRGRYVSLLEKEGAEDRRLEWLRAAEVVFGTVPSAEDDLDDPPTEETSPPDSAPSHRHPEVHPEQPPAEPPPPPPARSPAMRPKRLVYIDIQHLGKPPAKMNDRGATADLNHNGRADLAESEARWTPAIAFHLELLLSAAGCSVIPISDGWYSARHKRVNSYAADALGRGYHHQAYIALHLNSLIGGVPSDKSGDYASFFFHHRSAKDNGPKLAKAIAGKMAHQLVLAGAPGNAKAIAAAPGGAWANAYSTIGGLGSNVVGICAEPYFMDQIAHPITEAGMKAAALAISEGLTEWFLAKERQ